MKWPLAIPNVIGYRPKGYEPCRALYSMEFRFRFTVLVYSWRLLHTMHYCNHVVAPTPLSLQHKLYMNRQPRTIVDPKVGTDDDVNESIRIDDMTNK